MADDSGSPRQEDIDQLLKQSDAAPAKTGAVDQSEIDALLKQAPSPAARAPLPGAALAAASSGDATIAPQDMELLIRQAEAALASIDQPLAAGPEVKRFRFDEFTGAPPSAEAATLELLRDVELDLKIELGRTQMYLEDILKLRRGSVVPLEKLAGDPVDIYVNGRLIARGEVLVLNDNFCVRVAELVASEVAAAG
ncbi:MAG: flagellar motor switch protein FliN [Planctomycetes bacterium]|nr:flagellar motor switch protein FliN [Planctomycetota bacterium]